MCCWPQWTRVAVIAIVLVLGVVAVLTVAAKRADRERKTLCIPSRLDDLGGEEFAPGSAGFSVALPCRFGPDGQSGFCMDQATSEEPLVFLVDEKTLDDRTPRVIVSCVGGGDPG